MVAGGSVSLAFIDRPSISLYQSLNSHRSGIQEFPEIYLIMN